MFDPCVIPRTLAWIETIIRPGCLSLTHGNILALREHLLAQVHNTHPVPLKVESLQPTSSVSPQDQNIDPAIAGAGIMATSTGESGGDENGSDGKKGGKRALSTSKRAAQNRQAQVCV